jgi:hypothetical protein
VLIIFRVMSGIESKGPHTIVSVQIFYLVPTWRFSEYNYMTFNFISIKCSSLPIKTFDTADMILCKH